MYAFLSQIITFSDPGLERLHLFSRYLKCVLPVDREKLPREIQDQIDMESYGIRTVVEEAALVGDTSRFLLWGHPVLRT